MAAPEAAGGERLPGLMGTRAEAMQRLKVGVAGLLLVLFVVAMASSIVTTTREADDTGAAASPSEAPAAAANDPLVDIGVAPELPGESEDVAVPDLPSEQMPPEAQGANGE